MLFLRVLLPQQCACRRKRFCAVARLIADGAVQERLYAHNLRVLLECHDRNALRGSRRLRGKKRRGENKRPAVGGVERKLLLLRQLQNANQWTLIGVRARQLAAVRFRRVTGELDLRAFAVFKDEEQISRVVARENGSEETFSLVEAELAGKIVSK